LPKKLHELNNSRQNLLGKRSKPTSKKTRKKLVRSILKKLRNGKTSRNFHTRHEKCNIASVSILWVKIDSFLTDRSYLHLELFKSLEIDGKRLKLRTCAQMSKPK
jgi:hypothetical protein